MIDFTFKKGSLSNEVSSVEEVMMKKQALLCQSNLWSILLNVLFQGTSLQQTKQGSLEIEWYAATLFLIHLTPPSKPWQNVFELPSGDNDKDDCKPVLLIVELVMCAPQSNKALERLFS